MDIALRQIENAFVQSLARDYDNWVVNKQYRELRAKFGLNKDVGAGIGTEATSIRVPSRVMMKEAAASIATSAPDIAEAVIVEEVVVEAVVVVVDQLADQEQDQELVPSIEDENTHIRAMISIMDTVDTTPSESEAAHTGGVESPLAILRDDICLTGEPSIHIEEAPLNARYTLYIITRLHVYTTRCEGLYTIHYTLYIIHYHYTVLNPSSRI